MNHDIRLHLLEHRQDRRQRCDIAIVIIDVWKPVLGRSEVDHADLCGIGGVDEADYVVTEEPATSDYEDFAEGLLGGGGNWCHCVADKSE